MRLPGRLHITWDDDNTLKMDIDAGTQTRRFVFGAAPPAAGEPSWQGVLVGALDVSSGRARPWSGAAADGSAGRDDDSDASRLPAQERHPVQRQRHVHRILRAARR